MESAKINIEEELNVSELFKFFWWINLKRDKNMKIGAWSKSEEDADYTMGALIALRANCIELQRQTIQMK